MEDAKKKNSTEEARRRRPGNEGVGIDFKPAPDAEERLSRLFTILLKLAEDDPPLPGTDPSRDGGEEDA